MNTVLTVVLVIFVLVAAWFAWRYFDLRKRLNEYAHLIQNQPDHLPTDVEKLEDLSSAISSLHASFNLELAALNSEIARLATVLEQLTDGVLIADAKGIIQFANPAASKLFETKNPPGKSVAEVV